MQETADRSFPLGSIVGFAAPSEARWAVALVVSLAVPAVGATPDSARSSDPPLASEGQAPISVDGVLEDWADVDVAYVDPPGDDGSSDVDFRRVWIADDDRFFFMRFETTAELDLGENNSIRLYLDTDANPNTGLAIGGIGAELEWRLGSRVGTFRFGGNVETIYHDDILFRSGPTVTATDFEIAIARDARPDGVNLLFRGEEVRVVVRDVGGDQTPESGDTLAHFFDRGELPPEVETPIDRKRPTDLRLATYNVLNDGPWNSGEPSFARQARAVAPDVFAFQEIYDHSPAQTKSLVEDWLPDRTWYAAGHDDCQVVSVYDVVDTWTLDGNLAALLATEEALGADMLLIIAHLPCCTNDDGRQDEVDRIMSFVRDAKEPGGTIDVPAGTPIVITGDLNLVGLARQLITLLTGDIVDEGRYGPDFAPDWDGTDLLSVIPRQTELRMGYTWRNDNSSFWPGHLDYIITTDAAVDVARSYVLYTPEMSDANLEQHGLLWFDSRVSDHLMFVADFRTGCAADLDGSGTVDFADLLQLLSAWGPCKGPCPEDLDDSGAVDFGDLLLLLSFWGEC